MDEDDLERILLNLDHCCEHGCCAEQQKWADEFNMKMRLHEMFSAPQAKGAGSTGSGGLDFVAGIVRNKGIRLSFLEKALHCNKVVLGGSVSIKQNFLDAIRGNQPLHIDFENPVLRLTINF